MSRHVVWVILAVSIVFNLFFAASYVTARSTGPSSDPPATITTPGGDTGASADSGSATPDRARPGDGGRRGGAPHRSGRGGNDIMRRVGDQLELDADQQVYFQALHTGMASDDAIFETAIDAVRERLMESYAAEQPDPQTIAGLHEDEAELLAGRRRARAERFEAFMLVLRPEQVSRFRALADRGGRGGGDRESSVREHLERFDADGDGRLDAEEVAAIRADADARIDAWRARTIEQRRLALEQYDADGDGTLSREERDAMLQDRIRDRFDHDGDGTLNAAEQAESDAELKRMRDRMRDRRGGRGGAERGEGDARNGREGRRPGGRTRGGERRGPGETDGPSGSGTGPDADRPGRDPIA